MDEQLGECGHRRKACQLHALPPSYALCVHGDSFRQLWGSPQQVVSRFSRGAHFQNCPAVSTVEIPTPWSECSSPSQTRVSRINVARCLLRHTMDRVNRWRRTKFENFGRIFWKLCTNITPFIHNFEVLKLTPLVFSCLSKAPLKVEILTKYTSIFAVLIRNVMSNLSNWLDPLCDSGLYESNFL